jgi:hypothetical protein
MFLQRMIPIFVFLALFACQGGGTTNSKLTVVLRGLPKGALVEGSITGPKALQISGSISADNGEYSLTDSFPPGDYSISLKDQATNDAIFGVRPNPQSLSLVAGQDKSITLDYTIQSASLSTGFAGLPATLEPTAVGNAVLKRDGVVVVFAKSLVKLTPGNYSLSLTPVADGNTRYLPKLATQDFTLAAGQQKQLTLEYQLQSATLKLVLTGLPNGVNGNVNINGPNGLSQNVTATTTLSDLAPGSYTISAQQVSNGADSYLPMPISQTLSLASGSESNASVAYSKQAPSTGSLSVTITGLPNGVNGNVNINGPNTNQTITGTATLSNLTPGNYAITGVTVVNGADSYTASAAQMVSVTAGNTASATISYSKQGPTTGSLALTITGLPNGVNGNVGVTGPNGFSQSVTASKSFVGLVPGNYSVSAQNVSSGGENYLPMPISQSKMVVAGESANLSVLYIKQAAMTGSLSVSITGLPNGVAGNVTITGPSTNQNIGTSQTLSNLSAGSYTVTGQTVTAGADSYLASPAQIVAVTAGNTTNATVTYSKQGPTTGGLSVTITGLPNGVSGNVTITGPNTNQTISSDQTLSNLSPGSYTVTGQAVSNGTESYAPSAAQTVAVSAGNIATATVSYSKQVGALTVTITGLPNGVNANANVSGPNTNQNLIGTTTLSNLNPGSYNLTAQNVVSGADTYLPNPSNQTVSVQANQTNTVSVTYSKQAPTTGGLSVTITGLPNGVNGNVTVTGPSTNQNLTSTTTINNLTPGNYTVTGMTVTNAGDSYTASPAQMVAVTAGNTTSATVTYTKQVGALTVTVTGLPNGVNGNVAVTGPNSFSQNVTSTTTINNLTPGNYTVTGVTVTNGADSYTASAAQMVAVTAGNTASATITYTKQVGALRSCLNASRTRV